MYLQNGKSATIKNLIFNFFSCKYNNVLDAVSTSILYITIQPYICLDLFCLVNNCLICADFSPDSDQTTFSLQEVLLMDYGFVFWPEGMFRVKNLLMDLFLQISNFVFSRC